MIKIKENGTWKVISGSGAASYVDISSNQTIGGLKNFTTTPTVNGTNVATTTNVSTEATSRQSADNTLQSNINKNDTRFASSHSTKTLTCYAPTHQLCIFGLVGDSLAGDFHYLKYWGTAKQWTHNGTTISAGSSFAYGSYTITPTWDDTNQTITLTISEAMSAWAIGI